MEIRKLKKENYDELLSLMNTVFSKKNKRIMDFTVELPKMCVKDDEHMQKHVGLFEEGKMCAALGVYPLPVLIGKEELLFSTVGNVATLPEYEGLGYMTKLLDFAMSELEVIGADASRLGGNRQRYNRYGYEYGGALYNYVFSEYNRVKCFPDFKDNVEFFKIKKDNTEALKYTLELHNTGGIHVVRSAELNYRDVYATLIAWRNTPYLIYVDGERVGYMCVNSTQDGISEIHLENKNLLTHVLCAWQKECGENVKISFAPYDVDYIKDLYRISPSMSITSPSLFKIINWDRVIGALLRLKASYTELPTGESVIGIKDYGNILITSRYNEILCEKTSLQAAFEMDCLEMTRLAFDPFPAGLMGVSSAYLNSIFPLPLSWNLQDRV